MKLGLIGLPGSGKLTIFQALTKNIIEKESRKLNQIGTVLVPDKRLSVLKNLYNPLKTVPARVEYFLAGEKDYNKGQNYIQHILNHIRNCDALIHVVRNFQSYGFEKPTPFNDFRELNQEMILADQLVVEKRLDRFEIDKKRGKPVDNQELALLKECLNNLENEVPIRNVSKLAGSRLLKGYAFISAKPQLVLFNNEDDDDQLPDLKESSLSEKHMLIKGQLELEIIQMPAEDAKAFLAEYNINLSAMDKVINRSYELLGLVSFFTVGEDEVKAWTIKNNIQAVDAAGVIHSDIKQGFIRAEIVSYHDLLDAGSYHEARKKGLVRLEGKNYCVQDGDIINFRFNV